MANPFVPYFWGNGFNPPIASEFDKAISYEQQLRCIYKYVADFVKNFTGQLSEFEKETYDKILAGVNAQLEDLRNEIAEEIATVNEEMNYTQEKIEILDTKLMDFIDTMQEAVAQLRTDLTTVSNSQSQLTVNFLQFKRFIEQRYEQLEEQLKEEIMEAVGNSNGDTIVVTNPVTARKDTLKRTLNALYGSKVYYGVSVGEINMIGISVGELNELSLTVGEINEHGSLILMNWWGRKGVSELQSDVKTLYADTDSIHKELDSVDDELSDLRSTYAALSQEIETLKTSDNSILTAITELNERVTDLEGKVSV